MKQKTKIILRRILVLVIVVAIVVGYGLFKASDSTLKATDQAEEEVTRTVDGSVDATEEYDDQTEGEGTDSSDLSVSLTDDGDLLVEDGEGKAASAGEGEADAKDQDQAADGEDSEKAGEDKPAAEGIITEETTMEARAADDHADDSREYAVSVTFGADASLPVGSQLDVKEILPDAQPDEKGLTYDDYLEEAALTLGLEADTVSYARFFDISILDAEDQPVQPAEGSSLDVKISLADAQSEDLSVVHFGEQTELVASSQEEAKKGKEGCDLSFETESVHVYAVVGTVIEKNVLASDGKNYKVAATYGAETGIPEGAELEVEEILPDEDGNADSSSVYGEDYDAYVSKTEDALGIEKGSAGYIRLFDIKIVDKDDHEIKYQPKAGTAVDVRIELADSESSELRVVHFADQKEEGDVIENITENASDGAAVAFQAERFSVYSIVDVKEPEGQEEVTATSLADLDGNGFYISSDWNHSGTIRYMTTNYNGDKSFGSTKSKETAAIFYFEKDASDGASGNDFYLYYLDESNHKVYLTGSGSGSGWKPGFDETGKPFKVYYVDTNVIRIKMPAGWTYTLGNYGDPFTWNAANDADTHGRFKLELVPVVEAVKDPYSLDGKSYGIVYNHDSINALALTTNDTGLGSRDVLIRPDVLEHQGTLLVSPGSDISKWTFACVEGDVYTIQDEKGNYLSISSAGVALKDTADDTCQIKITAGSDAYAGKIRLSSGGYALSTEYIWNNNTSYTFTGFRVSQTENAETWFNLANDSKLDDDDFYSYSAEKISASDEILSAAQKDENGAILKDESGDPVYKSDKARVVVYTRVWNDTTKSYEYYAVDHDGTLVRVYESGDNINWVGSSINTMLWEFTEYTYDDGSPNYYYELMNTVYHNYLAPQLMSDQVISDETVGINLNGRRYGQDYTSIIAWDDAAYSFSGLKAENGRIVPCALSEADDFYFACMHEEKDERGELTTVDTVDNSTYGITMKIQNYPYQNYYISGDEGSVYPAADGGYRSEMQAKVLGYDNKASSNGTGEGLLSTDLKGNGYPDTTYLNKTGAGNTSLEQLYSQATPVNHLFLQSTYNETGYFEYDSTQNYAQLDQKTGDFTVYEQLATGQTSGNPSAFHAHGMFLPYNDITKATYSDVLYNTTDMSAHELPDSDPRKGERLYQFDGSYPGAKGTPKKGAADYFFGMELEASFTQTPNGLDAWGHDIIFEFSGDDDFWLYVDGELVVDLGGVRAGSGASGGAQSAKVNFSTGQVLINNKSTTLYDLFKGHFDARVQAGEMTQAAADAKLAAAFTTNAGGNQVFADYSNHTMKIFYMERGAGASNLHMKFNLAAVKPGTVELTKKLSGSDSESNSLIEFPYQIYYKQKADGGNRYQLLTPDQGTVTYKNSITNVTYKNTLRIGGEPYSSVYMLKPGETAVISLPDDTIDYYIVECGVNTAAYNKVSANGTELKGRRDTLPQDSAQSTETSEASGARQNFSTTAATTADRPQVEYDNHVAKGAMRTLTISKKLYDADGETELSYDAEKEDRKNETLFDFRLYLGNEYSEELSGANLYSYFVKNAEGQYCLWDRAEQRFAVVKGGDDAPIADYDLLSHYLGTLSLADQESIVFKTSMNGSISKIPAGYSVEVRDLVIGSKWEVEERDNEIPKGYTRRESDGYTRVDTDPKQTQSTPISDTMEAEDSPQVEIRNQKGWGLTVEKLWTDKDFMESHDDIYFAVYLNAPKDSDDANDTLIGGTVRRLKNSETEIYYFFDDLRAGTNTTYTFDQFVVREVILTEGENFQVDDGTGLVTGYSAVTPIDHNGTLDIGGQAIGGAHQEAGDNGFQYTVSYEVGASTGRNENIRTDTVTNSRPGIKLYKMRWDYTTPLADTVFTLRDNKGKDVAAESYTSGSDGLITIAYLNPGTYTLDEIRTPKGYAALEEPLTIKVGMDAAHTISVTGPEGDYTYTEATQTEMATIAIRNRSVELQVKKVDAADNAPLRDVHFALYQQVENASGEAVRDYNPIAGYADLVTNEQGVLMFANADGHAGEKEAVTLTKLDWGKSYYLSETEAAEGYAKLNDDICFTVGVDGRVGINSTGHSDWLTWQTDPTSETTTYTLTIPNGQAKDFTFHKVWYPVTGDEKQDWQKDITVTLYKKSARKNDIAVATYSISMLNGILTASPTDGENAPLIEVNEADENDYSFTIKDLPFGDTYYLVESDMDGNLIKYGNEVDDEIQVTQGAKKATEDTPYIINRDTGGQELPSTGGSGTLAFTILGSVLIAGAGLMLVRRKRSV